jgi:hypothetical protein
VALVLDCFVVSDPIPNAFVEIVNGLGSYRCLLSQNVS